MSRKSKYEASVSAAVSWRAGLYIRLSREDGDRAESESVSSQRAILNRFLDENPEITFYDFYIDDGWSGTDFNRPSFCRMLGDVTGKKINCVIVKDLSRFGRNYVEAGKYLESVFPLFNVRFIAVNDGVDSYANPSSMSSVIVPFKNIMNDEYCRDISIKVRSALDIRRRQGKFIGSFAAYGYKKDENDHNKLVIDGRAAEVVREIFNRFLSGESIIGITRRLNDRREPSPSAYKSNTLKSTLWCDATVRRILKNEVYIGNLVQKKNEVLSHKLHIIKPVAEQNRIKVLNTHEPIISVEDFNLTQDILSRDTRISPKDKKLSLFSGYIKCADCGRAMQRRTVGKYGYYVCSTHKKSKSSCTKHAIREDVLKSTVLAFLNRYIAIAVDCDALLKKIASSPQKSEITQKLEGEIKKTEREISRVKGIILELYPDFKDGIIDKEQYLLLKEKYENKREELQSSIDGLKSELQKIALNFQGNDFIEAFKSRRGLIELSRDTVTELIENIYIFEGGGVEIRLKFKNSLISAQKYLAANEITRTAVDKPL